MRRPASSRRGRRAANGRSRHNLIGLPSGDKFSISFPSGKDKSLKKVIESRSLKTEQTDNKERERERERERGDVKNISMMRERAKRKS